MQILNLFHRQKLRECQNSHLVSVFISVFLFFPTFLQESNREMTNFNLISLRTFGSFLSLSSSLWWSLHADFNRLFVCYIFLKFQCIVTEWKIFRSQKRIWYIEKRRFGLFCNFHFEFVCSLGMNVCFRQRNPISSCCFSLNVQVVIRVFKRASTHTLTQPHQNETIGEMSWKDTWDSRKDS